MKIKKVLLIGSGALKIGEAGEFDYSGTQALKAIREEGIFTVLINPNVATVQTSEGIADKVYLLPIHAYFVEQVIQKETPDGLILAFGGQTALSCGLELYKKGIIEKYKLKVLGTPIQSIVRSEDRALFRKELQTLGIKNAISVAVDSIEKAMKKAEEVGFPMIVRSSYALGGLGSGFAYDINELKFIAVKAFSYTNKIILEESLKGWKEIEYEVIRDRFDNCIAVCNMENIDPIGVHTGESVVVAPSQTLSNSESYNLRDISTRIIRHFGIIGECNVQFALSPNSVDYRVIEVNARLSRSSALASKATAYPLAFIASKLALGYGLHKLNNIITGITSAFFEPALDYIVCKLPRWDLKKFDSVYQKISSSMKSVGEVMSLGGSFEEALQKGLRMLDLGLLGFINPKKLFLTTHEMIEEMLKNPTDKRIQVIESAFYAGFTIEEIHHLTMINPWFLKRLESLFLTKNNFISYGNWSKIPYKSLIESKKQGFSDEQIASFFVVEEDFQRVSKYIRKNRKSLSIIPFIRRVDTLAAEYPANTNYLYLSYHAAKHDVICNRKSILILGSGVYRIGSSVEFDWCSVKTLETIKEIGYQSLMINYNPETVSTDFDKCDRLYFEELSIERILDILELEKPLGIIASMGGQITNNLALKLYKSGIPVLGTSPISIDKVENRHIFSKSLDILGISQPLWQEFSDFSYAEDFTKKVGFPVLLRPSYVLSGASMQVVYNYDYFNFYIKKYGKIATEHTIVLSKFIENAKEIEFDAVAAFGKIFFYAISEHVEFAGIHSGDATLIYPPKNIGFFSRKKIERLSQKIAKHFNISGPFNIQFLLENNHIQVIECNLRASRSFPLVSKVSNINMIDLATKAIFGKKLFWKNKNLNMSFLGVKASQFSFSRLHGSDPILGVEMTSTGEVASIGISLEEALMKAMFSAGYRINEKNIFINALFFEIEALKIYALFATWKYWNLLYKQGIKSIFIHGSKYIMKVEKLDVVINISKKLINLDDDYVIRRAAIDLNIPLITDCCLAKTFINAFCKLSIDDLYPVSLDTYNEPISKYRRCRGFTDPH
ncbi:MAG TPA: carbamoyl-phosphate synthase (glutamine-hydrolyzing) large subunit [Blattabacteriaceae bacterium]